MSEFRLSKRSIINEDASFQISKRAQITSAKKTAESLYKIVQFLFYRVPEKSRQKFLSRLKGKIIRIHPGVVGMKKLQPGNSIGQAISLTKGVLSGLNPVFVGQVLQNLARLLTSTIGYVKPIPPGVKLRRGK